MFGFRKGNMPRKRPLSGVTQSRRLTGAENGIQPIRGHRLRQALSPLESDVYGL
jgi:hypothetical protein